MDGGRGLQHQPALDGLRGVAVIAVIAFHLWPDAVPGGFLGVDTFFVVSGYLITSLLLAEHGSSGRIDLAAFWVRRARRLLPALFVMLAVVAVAAAWWWPAEDLARIRGDALAGLGYVANWHALAGGEGYFDSVRGPSPLGHLWSLAIEEQFYVLWPVVVFAVLRWRVRGVRVVAAAGLAVSIGLVVVLQADLDRVYFGTDTRAQALLIGALLATYLAPGASVRRITPGVGGAALAACALSWFVVDETSRGLFTFGMPAYAALTAVVIAGAVGSTPPGVLVHRWTVAVGRVSYGLYLWHWPVIVLLTPVRTGLDGPALLALRVVATVAITLASYRFVERPIRHSSLAGVRALRFGTAAFATTAAVVVLAATGSRPAPAYLEVSAAEPAVEPVVVLVPAAPVATRAKPLVRVSTVQAPPPQPPSRVLLVGDSIAFTLQDELGAALASHGVSFAAATAVGCGAAAGVDPTVAVTADAAGVATPWAATCAEAVPELQGQGLATGPDLVVFHSSWETSDRLVGGTHVPFGTPPWDDIVRVELEAAVDRLAAGGRVVAFLSVPPIVDGELRSAPADDNRRLQRYGEILAAVARDDPARVVLVDLAALVCGGLAPCPSTLDGVVLRPLDGAHFEPDGAALVAPRLADLLLAIDLGPGARG